MSRHDPAALSAKVVAYYEMGGDVAPLPDDLDEEDRELVEALLDMLWRSEEGRYDPRPLPLEASR